MAYVSAFPAWMAAEMIAITAPIWIVLRRPSLSKKYGTVTQPMIPPPLYNPFVADSCQQKQRIAGVCPQLTPCDLISRIVFLIMR